MGRLLMAQGALQEAIVVFQLFVDLVPEVLGEEDDGVGNDVRKILKFASKEREDEVGDEVEGRVGSRWGCMTFQRMVDELGKGITES